jgi:5-(carboxyamino)imidazole ribonucleotide synthase
MHGRHVWRIPGRRQDGDAYSCRAGEMTRALASLPTPAAGPMKFGTATLGVMGGGQLGRMFVHAAQTLGFKVMVLEPDVASPAAGAADVHLAQAYLDGNALTTMGERCAAVTTEFENVPAAALEQLAELCAVAPAASAVRVCQHRAAEKQAFTDAGVPCAPYRVIESADDVAAALAPGGFPGWPAILKTSQLGYDGKGQVQVTDAASLPAAWLELRNVPCVLEQRLPLQLEISVIVARGADGVWVHLPPQQNLHRQGVLAVTQVPAPDVAPGAAAAAVQEAARLAEALAYVGVLCVEFFVLQDGRLVANEMAPRPHNSGHYSIDACDLSQFDLQVRTLAGLPLPPPRLHSAAVMLNLMGDLWFTAPSGLDGRADDAEQQEPDWPAVLALPGVHLHLYGKAQARAGRKMGHLTVTAATAVQARATALQAAELLGLPAF